MKFKVPALYGDSTYDSNNSTFDTSSYNSSCSSSCSSSSSSSSSSGSSPKLKTAFNVVLPLFTFLQINTWLLSTWTFPPAQRYLRNIIQSYLKDAKMYIWNLPAGVLIRESIKEARGTFIKSLYTATNRLQEIDTWIMELWKYAMKVRTSPRSRKSTEFIVKYRAANLTCRSTLTRFGHIPQPFYGYHGICQSRTEGALCA